MAHGQMIGLALAVVKVVFAGRQLGQQSPFAVHRQPFFRNSLRSRSAVVEPCSQLPQASHQIVICRVMLIPPACAAANKKSIARTRGALAPGRPAALSRIPRGTASRRVGASAPSRDGSCVPR